MVTIKEVFKVTRNISSWVEPTKNGSKIQNKISTNIAIHNTNLFGKMKLRLTCTEVNGAFEFDITTEGAYTISGMESERDRQVLCEMMMDTLFDFAAKCMGDIVEMSGIPRFEIPKPDLEMYFEQDRGPTGKNITSSNGIVS